MRAVLVSLVLAAAAAGQEPGAPTPAVLLREPLDAPDGRWHRVLAVADGASGAAAGFRDPAARIDVGPCPVSADAPFTLRCALRTTAAGFCTPLMARDGDAVGLSLVLGREPGRVSFEAWSWRTVRLVSRRRVDDGAWHRIEVSYDPATNAALLVVDGEVEAHGVLGPGGAATARLRLGNNIGADQPFPGDLDEIEVVATASHPELFAVFRPIVPEAERRVALAALRDRLLPPRTESLAPQAAAAWPGRRAEVRRRVADCLGLLPEPARVDPDVQVHGELRGAGVRLLRVSWIGFPGMRATGWLWLPDPAPAGRRPAVLCPHGHWQHGAIHPVVQARCAAFARLGWLALAVDSVHVEDVATGVNAIGAMTWHNQRALDWLLARDDVDPARVAVTGASGGGQQTYYLMALEDRLAAAAPIVMACYWREILDDTGAHCGCNHTPGLAAFTDVPEMCAVFAPRPAFFGTVTGDWTRSFPQEGLPELREHWQRLGGAAPGARHGDEGHNYDRPMREAVYAWLRPLLEPDAAAGAPVAEPAGGVFAREDLLPLLQRRPNAQLDRAAMAREHLARRGGVSGLAALAPGLTLPVAKGTMQRRDADPGDDWIELTVTGLDGVPIPVHEYASPGHASAKAITVILDPAGAAAAIARGLHERFANPVLVDPRPYGEWQPFRAAWQRNGLLYGRGEAFQAAVDVACVLETCFPSGVPVTVVGLGEASVVALLTAHLSDRVAHVATEALGPPYAADGNRLPLAPGLLRFGDLDALVDRLPDGVTHGLLPAGR